VNIDVVAAQIKRLAPIFNGNVAGAASYANGVVDQVWLDLPAAYVVPLGQEAEANILGNGLEQTVHERVGVIVVLETLKVGGEMDPSDRRAQAASAYTDTIRQALFTAILNWRPDWDPANPTLNREARGLYFNSADFPAEAGWDRARFFYQYIFTLDTMFTDADGWQLLGDPLWSITPDEEIEAGTGSPAPVVSVNILPAPTTT
jgi:hypothetical protein